MLLNKNLSLIITLYVYKLCNARYKFHRRVNSYDVRDIKAM